MPITDSQISLANLASAARQAALAGHFYPADATELDSMVQDFLVKAKSNNALPKVMVVPHAGYIYSGSTAAEAYKSLLTKQEQIKRVVLLGPAHRVHTRGLACPSVQAFNTPLGDIKIDSAALKHISSLPQVSVFDETHKNEHSLEVQLPFLQASLSHFTLVPLVVGDASVAEVEEVLNILWGGDETLIVISSDLSHFHNYDQATERDLLTAGFIENFNHQQIKPENACGCRPLNGLLSLAKQRRMKIERVALCNSGDTAGSRDRVVGYGAWLLFEATTLSSQERDILLRTARESIENAFTTQNPLIPSLETVPETLTQVRASFITLKLHNNLRGCIGTTTAVQPLITSVAQNAFSAAFRDPRFPPLSKDEFSDIELSISVLSPPELLHFESETELLEILEAEVDGLIIASGNRRATFLPSVWESIPSKSAFLTHLKKKAGITEVESVQQAWRYQSESFS